jgi:hypothetical protein
LRSLFLFSVAGYPAAGINIDIQHVSGRSLSLVGPVEQVRKVNDPTGILERGDVRMYAPVYLGETVWHKTDSGALPVSPSIPYTKPYTSRYYINYCDNPAITDPNDKMGQGFVRGGEPWGWQTHANYAGDNQGPIDVSPSALQHFNWVITPPDGGMLYYGVEGSTISDIREGSPLTTPLTIKKYWHDIGVGTSLNPENHINSACDRVVYDGNYDDDAVENFDKVWKQFYENPIVDSYKGSFGSADNIPYLTAIAPTPEETLVAVLRVNKSKIYYVWRIKDEIPNRWINTPFTTHTVGIGGEDVQRYYGADLTTPMFGCPEIYCYQYNIGYLDWPYRGLEQSQFEGVTDETFYEGRQISSVVYPAVSWDAAAHDSFFGYTVTLSHSKGGTYNVVYPWMFLNGDKESPILTKTKVFDIDHNPYVMTFRKKALLDSGPSACDWGNSWHQNPNFINPSESDLNIVTAANRNKDSCGS